jgi:energy-converting hydrogenase Eha subunit A
MTMKETLARSMLTMLQVCHCERLFLSPQPQQLKPARTVWSHLIFFPSTITVLQIEAQWLKQTGMVGLASKAAGGKEITRQSICHRFTFR